MVTESVEYLPSLWTIQWEKWHISKLTCVRCSIIISRAVKNHWIALENIQSFEYRTVFQTRIRTDMNSELPPVAKHLTNLSMTSDVYRKEKHLRWPVYRYNSHWQNYLCHGCHKSIPLRHNPSSCNVTKIQSPRF